VECGCWGGYDVAKALDKLLDAAETRAWIRASTQVRPRWGGGVGDRERNVGVGGGYDAAKAMDRLLDAAETRAWMRASTEVRRGGHVRVRGWGWGWRWG
jgi:hypothetical protein